MFTTLSCKFNSFIQKLDNITRYTSLYIIFVIHTLPSYLYFIHIKLFYMLYGQIIHLQYLLLYYNIYIYIYNI